MPFLKSLAVRNFKCFREEATLELAQASYLIGANNSGKTSFLSAIRCFFDDTEYEPSFLNKSERARRQEGATRSEITVTFDLSEIPQKVRRKRLIDRYGPLLTLRKTFSFREISGVVDVDYHIGKKSFRWDDLDSDLKDVVKAVSISYIHPQEGAALLRKAQEKFKQRLFQNWGRHSSVADKVKAVQQQWEELRKTANSYLSSTLTERLRGIWPDSEIRVDLPDRIDEIVAISDISFRSSPSLPEVTLPAHGTGAQSTILYHTHYLLDSDRTLHRGMYFPVWLLEEPESFLHADIAVQLSRLLSSPDWLNSIQMVISTHSPIVLAGSRQSADLTRWTTLDAHAVTTSKRVDEVDSTDIRAIGLLMGDANFDVYFAAAQRGSLIFLEDSRDLTRDVFVAAGVPVTEGLAGITDVKKYLTVLPAIGSALRDDAIAIVDRDKGLKDIRSIVDAARKGRSVGGWQELHVGEHVRLILLPEGAAVEDLFPEWDAELEAVLDEIFEAPFKYRASVPTSLARTVGALRSIAPDSRAKAKAAIRSMQEVKDRFWERVRLETLGLDPKHVAAVKELISHQVA